MSGSANSNVGRVFNLTTDGGDMLTSVYDPTGQHQDIFAYADALIAAIVATYDPDSHEEDIFAYVNTQITAALANVGDMLASVYDPTGLQQDIFAYARNAAKTAIDNLYEQLLTSRDITKELCDNSGNAILDSSNNNVLGRLVFEIK